MLNILHNPRCSKSRQTLQLLDDAGHAPNVIEYLKTPLNAQELLSIKQKLGITSFAEMMRVKDKEFKEMSLNQGDVSEEQLLNAMLELPKLIERPIVYTEQSARIGRPPEQVLELFK